VAENVADRARLVRIGDLRACVAAAFERVGLTVEDAEQVADVLLDSELRGHESHGVYLVQFLTDEVRRGALNGRPNITALRETDSALLLDGDRGLVVPVVEATRWCLESARGSMAVAGIRSCQPVAPGFYARMVAEAGLVGFACVNAVPSVAPPGGRTPTVGTNPFAYAVPSGHHGTVVFDAATTTTAGFAVQLAAESGRQLPEGVLLDHRGHATTDPSARARGGLMAPLGYPNAAHKGFGLALMVEVLAGALAGAAVGREILEGPGAFGCTIWALDPEAVTPALEFRARVDTLVEQIKGGERMEGVDELLLPGERGERRFWALTSAGTVPISARTWDALARTCASIEVALPQTDDP